MNSIRFSHMLVATRSGASAACCGAVAVLVGSLLISCLAGCKPGGAAQRVDADTLARYQSGRILDEQPADMVGISELIGDLAGDDPNPERASSKPVQVALLGKLSPVGHDVPLFSQTGAEFSMIDPSYQAPAAASQAESSVATDKAGHDHPSSPSGEHDEQCDCAFCKSSAQAVPHAIVRFVDDKGQMLPVDPQQLFNVREGELVVVTGTAKLSVGQLLVTADKIYVRR